MLKLKYGMFLVWINCLIFTRVYAFSLNNLGILNGDSKSIIMLDFQSIPVYSFYILHNPERLIVDINDNVVPINRKKFPMNFCRENIVYCIRVSTFVEKNSIRFIFDLSNISCVDDVLLESIDGFYTVLLIVTKYISFPSIGSVNLQKNSKVYVKNSYLRLLKFGSIKNIFLHHKDNKSLNHIELCQMRVFSLPIVVAIDAGHGGHDPGARGYSGLYEKDITIAIARKFKKLLDFDPVFSPVMIREGDYFISVFKRSELARNKGAKILLSIHTNAISNNIKNNVRGASVWILSNRRADTEVTQLLENSNKWSQLSNGICDILMSSVNSDPYFSRMILDLQFSHSQRVGYEVALCMLRELKNVGMLYKYVPEYSNFGILRSLDIPSVLIETGFITHAGEEKLLASEHYQEKIAYALYKGLRAYYFQYVSDIKKKINHKSFHSMRNIYTKMML